MKRMILLYFNVLVTASLMIAADAALTAKSAILADQVIKKSNINLTIESEADIYGIQFDIRYNAEQLDLTEDAIVSKIPGSKIYNRIKEVGIARVLMFSVDGEKLLDITSNKIADLIDIQFIPKDEFRGTSVVELFNITLAGKAGIQINLNSSSTYHFEVSFLLPQTTSLSKNYPNPFNPTTTIVYELAEDGMVSLIIYDLKGSIVRTLIEEYQQKNYYNLIWNGLNESGQKVENGRYILKMLTAEFSDTITMTLLK